MLVFPSPQLNAAQSPRKQPQRGGGGGTTIRNKETKRRCGMPRRRKHDTREEDANRGRPPHPAVGLSRRQCKGGPGGGCAQCGNQGKRRGQKKSAHEEKARCAGLRRLRAADLRTSPAEFMAVFSLCGYNTRCCNAQQTQTGVLCASRSLRERISTTASHGRC